MRFSLFARATGGTRWLEKIAFGSRVGEGIGWTSAIDDEGSSDRRTVRLNKKESHEYSIISPGES